MDFQERGMKLISWLSAALGLRKVEAREIAKEVEQNMGPGGRVARVSLDKSTTVRVERDRSGRLKVGDGESRRLRESGRLRRLSK